jgi:FtsZ-binding cell division protein ZapB
MDPVQAPAAELSALATLEEKILRVVEKVRSLQRQNEALEHEKSSLVEEVKAAYAHKDTAQRESAELRKALQSARADSAQSQATAEEFAQSRAELARLTEVVARLQAERLQVRGRIEKLLGQIDLLAPGTEAQN